MNNSFADSRIGKPGRMDVELSAEGRERPASRDGRDFVEVEVLPAFFQSEVPRHPAPRQRHQKADVHRIELNRSIAQSRKEHLAVRAESDTFRSFRNLE